MHTRMHMQIDMQRNMQIDMPHAETRAEQAETEWTGGATAP